MYMRVRRMQGYRKVCKPFTTRISYMICVSVRRMQGYRRVSQLPERLRPTQLRTMDLPIIDSYFVWPDVVRAGFFFFFFFLPIIDIFFSFCPPLIATLFGRMFCEWFFFSFF